MTNLRTFDNRHSNEVFLKIEPKQIIDDLNPTENGEASEEPHCASDKAKLGLRCHLGKSIFVQREVHYVPEKK